MIDIVEKKDCTGCSACYNICPKNCITMEADVEGFVYPKINYSQCIECNLCEKVCHAINDIEVSTNYDNPEIHAAWSLNEEIRINSTSGGVFSELALNVLKSGGYICGAEYNTEHMVEHCIIDAEKELVKIRQSKYVQSDIGLIYKDIKILLHKNKTILFCGAPCECAGLLSFLGRKYDKLIVVDFVCRGANSPTVYKKFLMKLEDMYQSKVSKVWFKNKTYGWNRFSTKVEFENGKAYLEDRYSDLYMRGYIEANLYMRLCCSDCKYKTFPRVSDITLADFWGIKLTDISKDIEKGTSLLMINSNKGSILFNSIKDNIFSEEKTIEDAIGRNVCIKSSPKPNINKQEFIDRIDDMDILENIKRFCKK